MTEASELVTGAEVKTQRELSDKRVAADFTHSMWGDVVSWAIYNRPTALSILFHPVDEEQVRAGAQLLLMTPSLMASA